jgi:hypothetical protein
MRCLTAGQQLWHQCHNKRTAKSGRAKGPPLFRNKIQLFIISHRHPTVARRQDSDGISSNFLQSHSLMIPTAAAAACSVSTTMLLLLFLSILIFTRANQVKRAFGRCTRKKSKWKFIVILAAIKFPRWNWLRECEQGEERMENNKKNNFNAFFCSQHREAREGERERSEKMRQ